MSQSNSTEVVLRTEIEGLPPFIRGKVRDVYDLGDRLLIVTTDRISAYDSILPNGIPGKGQVLTQLSAFWFNRFRSFCPNHLLTVDTGEIMAELDRLGVKAPEAVLHGRTMLTRKTQALPVECVVRGYLDGSGWKEYRQNGSVCGIALPEGLQQGSQLPEPIFTPATKAHEGHDINITHAEMAKLVDSQVMNRAMELSIQVYRTASELARERGIVIADTKFEFGVLDGEVVMIDECLTPDSSRFWDASQWKPGGPQPSYDKQFVRDYLDSIGWDHTPPAPQLSDEVVRNTGAKYHDLFVRITGTEPA